MNPTKQRVRVTTIIIAEMIVAKRNKGNKTNKQEPNDENLEALDMD